MSLFIESLQCSAGVIPHLDLHQKRVCKTFAHYKQTSHLDLKILISTLKLPQKGVYKIRIVYSLLHIEKVEILPYQQKPINSFECIEAPEVRYPLKYKNREQLTLLLHHSTADEIIISQNGLITDTSYSNLIFLKEGQWYTPHTYLLNGVQRQYLLAQGLVKQSSISRDNLHQFSHFKMINALNNLHQAPTYSTKQILY